MKLTFKRNDEFSIKEVKRQLEQRIGMVKNRIFVE